MRLSTELPCSSSVDRNRLPLLMLFSFLVTILIRTNSTPVFHRSCKYLRNSQLATNDTFHPLDVSNVSMCCSCCCRCNDFPWFPLEKNTWCSDDQAEANAIRSQAPNARVGCAEQNGFHNGSFSFPILSNCAQYTNDSSFLLRILRATLDGSRVFVYPAHARQHRKRNG